MKKAYLFIALFCYFGSMIYGQEIQMTEIASLQQVYGEALESETLLPFDEFNVEFGYALYKTEIIIEEENAEFEIENVRDFAVLFINNILQGTLTDSKKKIALNMAPGKYELELYVENIGRITYGPEILDNSKGLFGAVTLDEKDVTDWKMIPLKVKECSVENLNFITESANVTPVFHKGYFDITEPKNIYLDIFGWEMGEVWVNGNYLGSYWAEEKQQSILISEDVLKHGINEVVVFELKNNKQTNMKLSDQPLFK